MYGVKNTRNAKLTAALVLSAFSIPALSNNQIGEMEAVLDWPLVSVSMANLPDGRILSYSGSERRTWPTTERTYSVIWDPVENHELSTAGAGKSTQLDPSTNGSNHEGGAQLVYDFGKLLITGRNDGSWGKIRQI